MTQTDIFCLTPIIIIASAPIAIMILISILRNYKIIFSLSVIANLLAFISLFFISTEVPHVIMPLFVIDSFSLFFMGIIILTSLLVVLLSYHYIKRLEGAREEYYIILFITTLGAVLLTVASHFVLFFLGIETLSISLYILIGFRKNLNSSVEAGTKYLILASGSSAFLLFGMALIYTAVGTMEFTSIARELSVSTPGSSLVIAGFGMMLTGIGFKLALVPFHMWTPDVYQGAPAPVAAYVATASKGAVMAVLIRFFFDLKGYGNHYLFVIISAIAVLSMLVGNVLAIRQQNIKRLLAYSSIANMGYLVIILLTGSNKGIQASVFYLSSYFITTIGAFGVISLLSSGEYEAENIDDYKGLFWKRPWIALVFTLSLLSLAGIPLTAGFMAKFYIILEGMNAGLITLVIALIINSVIGLYYYLRIITGLFSSAPGTDFVQLTFSGHFTLAVITLGILILGIYPGWYINILGVLLNH